MNTLTYENLHEVKKHVSTQFPYNTYLCSIPLDFTQVPLHWHNDVEIIVIKKGCGIISVDTEPRAVKAGDIILVRPGQLHSISQHEKDSMEYENILFQSSLLYSADSDPRTVGYFQPYFTLEYKLPWLFDDTCSSHEELSSCIDAIDDLCAKRPDYYELSVKGHLFHFFYLLFSSQGSPVTFNRSKSLDKVKQIVSYIESHYTEPITVQSAADYMGFSESHFMKFFKQHLHTTFTSYLNGYRLTIAAVKGHLFHFFYLLFSSQGSPVTFNRSKSLDKVKQIVSYIESHYTEPITVQSAADYMGFSESHFMKFFKQHLHTTFTSYLNGYRLTIAARLLLTEDDSILSISERTGFNNLSYFNRLFKKEYQMSPREYRNR